MKSLCSITQEHPINIALDYIENHLRDPLSPDRIAWYVGYSRVYLDQRFSTITGESLASYIRKRRLSEAARDLIASDKAILSIALDFQYQSAEAFTRAFYQAFRLTPSAYRKRKRLVRFFSRLRIYPQARLFYGLWKPLQMLGAKTGRPVERHQKVWRPSGCGRLVYPSNLLLLK